MANLPRSDLLRHVIDVHCHPTDASLISPESMENLSITICAMSSNQSDQARVRELASAYPDKVVPCFGHHPWFSHIISLENDVQKEHHYRTLFRSNDPDETAVLNELIPGLPDPIPLQDVLDELRRNFIDFPNAMLGEVGLDRSFRVAFDYYASPRKLTPFTVPVEHQLKILQAQIDLAIEFSRNISLHSVKAHQHTMDLLQRLNSGYGERWTKVSLDMHSCGFSPQMWSDIQKKYPNIFLSLSTAINSRSSNHRSLIDACSPDRILVESDYHTVDMCAERTWDMVQIVAEVKGWKIETEWTEETDESKWGVVRRLESNWKRFRNGNHQMVTSKRRQKFIRNGSAIQKNN
ncbi:Metallo-dependent hydrolase [Dendrothele bispora CBS 962.96]|uniref:Metallo-dependent hydrolase n=1 Tax=Dendrothele bispora (strain CBS 962.96) TaxID=1314807 RepID=A0A4S8MVY8_DENBC|nr:Metallo-dependent hydrolase [Dendrothele bispora CBS 962.96]